MTDVVGAALAAGAARAPIAYPLAAGAGLLTGFGPCVAPRYVALAGIGGRRAAASAAFAAGLILAYVALGATAGLLERIVDGAGILDLTLAVLLAGAGTAILVRGGERRARVPGGATPAAAFFVGAGSAATISPCCTPFVAAAAAIAVAHPLEAAGLLAAFAVGHAAPLLCAGVLGARIATVAACRHGGAPGAVVTGTLLLALGAYYAVLG